jgi:phosphatidylethanolamine-binding protein (PEBP) family uncharacterized protein
MKCVLAALACAVVVAGCGASSHRSTAPAATAAPVNTVAPVVATAAALAVTSTTVAPATAALTATGFVLKSSAMASGVMPADFTCDGASTSPPLAWSGAPAGTVGYAVVMHHVPGPGDTHWYWVLYDIPATVDHIDADATPPAAKVGTNSVNRNLAYAPPCSKGPGAKVYTLTVYALSGQPKLADPSAVSRDVLLASLNGLVLAEAHIDVTYTRP